MAAEKAEPDAGMTDEARVMSRVALPEETQVERQLRPQRLHEYVGQRAAVESLRVSVEAARQRGEPLDHVLLSGPPGLGKTTLAAIMANEMGANMVTTAGPSLDRGADLMGILTNLAERDVLFIDEIHRLPRVVEELLYPAMEDFSVNFVMDKGLNARTIRIPLRPFTMVGATTRPGMLSSPLRERFGIFHHLDFYSGEDLAAIVRRSASILGASIVTGGAEAIARRARGTPR
ncbi:MAG: Holliday junction branch migration DNA helicase RuvB, partial [Candidatus Rokuibacteriota bacterium]